MAYLVNPLLGSFKSEILDGIVNGRFVRWGGVIRAAAGQPNAGSIVAMLRDVLPRSMPSPMRFSDLLHTIQLHRIDRALATALQFTQIGAVTSVVNVGVSIAGFALIAAKLHRLQSSMAELRVIAERNHQDAMTALDRMQTHMVELRLLGARHSTQLDQVLQGIQAIRRDAIAEHLARMTATLELLATVPKLTERQHDEAAHAFRVARHWLRQTISDTGALPAEAPPWLDLLERFRAWCFACTSEILLARFADDTKRSAGLASEAAQQARAWATAWRDALVPPSELGGILRFGHRRFEALRAETFPRLLRLRDPASTAPEIALAAADAAGTLSTQNRDDAWFTQQHALADLLDFIEETVERLGSLADETAWCHARRLGWSRWEALAPTEDANGLAMIDVRGAA